MAPPSAASTRANFKRTHYPEQPDLDLHDAGCIGDGRCRIRVSGRLRLLRRSGHQPTISCLTLCRRGDHTLPHGPLIGFIVIDKTNNYIGRRSTHRLCPRYIPWRQERTCSTFQPTALRCPPHQASLGVAPGQLRPTSTRSRTPSPSSKPCCARPRPAPFRICGRRFGRRSPALNLTSAGTTSPPQATIPMIQPERQQL